MATATTNVPVTMNIADPAPLNANLVIQGQGPAGPAPAVATTSHDGWLVTALIAGLVIALCFSIFWPREHAVTPTTATTTAPADGYSPAEREADEAQVRALVKIEGLKRM